MAELKMLVRNALFGPIVPQAVWERLRSLSLRGLNIGGGWDIRESGELWLLDQLAPHLRSRKPAVVFDVGANVGSYSREVVRRLGGGLRLYCFEPAAAPFATLQAALAHDPEVVLNQLGLGDREGQMTLFTDPNNSALASLYRRDLEHVGLELSSSETVTLTTLDAYCLARGISHVDFLKLDCEGHELRTLEGAAQLRANGAIDAIQFEFGGCNLDSRTYLRDFFHLLRPDYRLYRILRRGLAPIPEYHERLEVFTTTNFLALRPNHPLSLRW
jgi:FkbM family methyltransferase